MRESRRPARFPMLLGTNGPVHLLLLAGVLASGFGCSYLPSDKRIRHSIKPEYSVSDPEFRNSMSHLLGFPLVEGNNVVKLLNGDRVFGAMLESIRGAKQSITIEQFIWS